MELYILMASNILNGIIYINLNYFCKKQFPFERPSINNTALHPIEYTLSSDGLY